MPPLPPLECLRFFEAAARRESFAKAAEELHVSSSAVAHRIKVLEKHLDCPLFDRSHRAVLLQGSVVEGGGLPTKGRLRSSVQLHQRASVGYVACLIHV